MYRPPAWATGYISGSDAAFLLEIIAALQPRTVVELGVASGASSAAILFALDTLPEVEGGRVLYSCDVRPTCYFDERYATGQACREMYPASRARWQLDTSTDARGLAAALPPHSIDLTFIDANHAHPWPLIDLLHAAMFARRGSWVVLHDIDLPVQHPEFQVYGPRWTFELWPFPKVRGEGQWTSIGAVQLPEAVDSLIPVALALAERPFEHIPPPECVRLPEPFAAVQKVLEARLR